MLSVRPRFSEFECLIRKGNLVPLSCEILADQDTPVSAFLGFPRLCSQSGFGCVLRT